MILTFEHEVRRMLTPFINEGLLMWDHSAQRYKTASSGLIHILNFLNQPCDKLELPRYFSYEHHTISGLSHMIERWKNEGVVTGHPIFKIMSHNTCLIHTYKEQIREKWAFFNEFIMDRYYIFDIMGELPIALKNTDKELKLLVSRNFNDNKYLALQSPQIFERILALEEKKYNNMLGCSASDVAIALLMTRGYLPEQHDLNMLAQYGHELPWQSINQLTDVVYTMIEALAPQQPSYDNVTLLS